MGTRQFEVYEIEIRRLRYLCGIWMFPIVGKWLHKQQELMATRRRSPCVPQAWGLISQWRGEKAGAPQPQCRHFRPIVIHTRTAKRPRLTKDAAWCAETQAASQIRASRTREWWRWLGGGRVENDFVFFGAGNSPSHSASVAFCSAAPIGSSFWDVIDHTAEASAPALCCELWRIALHSVGLYVSGRAGKSNTRCDSIQWHSARQFALINAAVAATAAISAAEAKRRVCGWCLSVSLPRAPWIHAQWYLHKWAPQR